MKQKYNESFVKNVIDAYDDGTPVKTICNQNKIPRSTTYYLLKKNRKNKPSQKEMIILRQRLNRQFLINKIHDEYEKSTFSKLDERIQFIENNLSNYSLTLLCEALGVSKSSYYLRSSKSRKTTYEIKRAQMTPIIKRIFHENTETVGALKIAKLMHQEGYHISPKTVADIMHQNGLFSVRSGSLKLYQEHLKATKNTLNRNFHFSGPNEGWSADVTEFYVNHHKYYFSSIMDLFSRKIISWKIGIRNSTQLIKTTFLEAYEKRKPEGVLLFHSDRGANYTSKVYCETLMNHGVLQSLSNPSQPYDNSVKEAFFSNLKQEEIYRRIYRSEKEMRKSISNYIRYYNEKRPHGYLNYKTPEQFECIYQDRKKKELCN